MNCNDAVDLISLYLDNELNKDSEKELFEHINECSFCRKEFEEMKENYDDVYSILVENQFAKSKLTVAQQAHITETALEDYNEFDITLANDSLDALKQKVFKFLDEVEANETTN